MKQTLWLAGLVAVVAAVTITALAEPRALDERLADIQTSELLPEIAGPLQAEPLAFRQVMLSFADEPLLLLKAKAAYLRYPELARRVLPLYGDAPEFRAALAEYGEQVLVPIAYFLDNEVRTVTALHAATHKYRTTVHNAREFFAAPGTPRAEAPVYRELDAFERGWYAVNFVQAEGYDFIGQFVLDGTGRPRWVQTERVLEGVTGLFASGIRDLERASRADEPVTAAHVGWAAVDAAIFVGVAKLAKSAATTRVATTGTRTAGVAATRSFARTAHSLGITRIALYGAIAYAVIAHPGLVSDALSAIARVLGLPEWLVLAVGWALILFPVFWLLLTVFQLSSSRRVFGPSRV